MSGVFYIPRWMVKALGESALRSVVRVCTMARRGMPEVRFGSDVYLWGRHESVLATLWRTIASQLASLGGGACCVVCLSSNCEQVWLLSGDRGAIFGGACVGVRERKHLRSKKYTKNRWALLRITTATQ